MQVFILLSIKPETKLQSISIKLLTFFEWHTVLSELVYAHTSCGACWVGERLGQGVLQMTVEEPSGSR